MVSSTASRLNKKSSSTLISVSSASAATSEDAKGKASSIASPSENMYKHTLRVQHTSRDVCEPSLKHSLASSTHSAVSGSGSGSGVGAVGRTAPAISPNSSFAHSASDDFGSPSASSLSRQQVGWGRDNSTSTSSSISSGKGRSGISLNVHDASEGQWRKITFPPGVTVGQARDLCMLRFNVWQRIMERDMQQMALGPAGSMATVSTRSSGGSSSGAKQFGLYWLGGAQWLDNSVLLNVYPLKPGDALALQDREKPVTGAVEALADHGEAQERALTTTAEGQMYYLQSKGISTSWRKCWMVLRAQTLYGYPSNRAGTAAQSPADKALVVVDLSCGFRLVDQHGQANRRVATSDQLGHVGGALGDSDSQHSSDSSSAGVGAMVGLAMAQGRRMGGDGAPLIIKGALGGVHVFCTLTAVDYDYWRRVLRVAQGPDASLHSGSSATPSPARQQQQPQPDKLLLPLPLPPLPLPLPPQQQQQQQQQASTQPAVSSLVHRPRSQPRSAHVVARPRRERFVANAFRRHDVSGIGSFCCCVLVPGALHGFRDMSVASDTSDTERLEQTADFSIHLSAEATAAISEVCAGRHVLRIVDCLMGDDLLWLDVGSRDKAALWSDALESIAGVTVDCVESQGVGALALRRSRSFVSNLSRIDWPMPPSTLPGVPNAGMEKAQAPTEPMPGESSGNPSLDAVGMRFAGERVERVASRFAWFRRGSSTGLGAKAGSSRSQPN
ncbi:hypothetical protein LPJ53_003486 [Coemansia erecta]|uniref:PH domain-containing protein n=1 Tax=Coemansia erecta TaxID=147472 RepID=A0A9W7XZZ7_9FUNG|nr:hypothetical protein LPJ53_003486 [Coemansia erecta]